MFFHLVTSKEKKSQCRFLTRRASPPLLPGPDQRWSRAKLLGGSEDLAWLLGNTQSLDSLPKICPLATAATCKALGLSWAALSPRGGTAHAGRKGISSDRSGHRRGEVLKLKMHQEHVMGPAR